MKFLFPALLFMSACSTVNTPYQAAVNKRDIGYWEVEVAKDAFRIHANLYLDMPTSQKFKYLAVRLGEICQKRGTNYFDVITDVVKTEGLRVDRSDLGEFSVLGVCRKSNFRRSLGVSLIARTGGAIEVDRVYGATPLKVGDQILSVNGVEPEQPSDVGLTIFAMGDSADKVELKVLRAAETLTFPCALSKNYDEVFDLSWLYSFQRSLQD